MRKPYILLLAFLLSFFSLFTYEEVSAETDLLEEAKQIIKSTYHGSIEGDLDTASSLEELMNMLDVHSNYYTYDEVIELLNGIDQVTVGVGIVVEQHSSGVLILTIIENSSADKGGLQSGDIITHVNGESVQGYNLETATNLIKGDAGTSVELTIMREGTPSFNVTLTREAFSVPVVTSEYLYGDIGYIALSSFSENGALEVRKAAKKLEEQGAKSFILDLRNNTGGLVSTAEQLIGFFPNTKVAYVEHTRNKKKTVAPANLNYTFPNTTRVLINRLSASASEMTAAAILDQRAGILYGERSYGKGSMQGFYSLSDGSMVKLTQAEFTGPSQTQINNVGVVPNIETTSPLEAAHFDQIKEQLRMYRPLKSFENVSVDKTFQLSFTNQVAKNIDDNAIELVALGGNKVPITITQDGTKLTITPNKPLQYGKHYVLIVHTSLKSEVNKSLRYGYYSYITVKK